MLRIFLAALYVIALAPLLAAEEGSALRCGHALRLEEDGAAEAQYGRGRPFDVQHIRIEVTLDFEAETVGGTTTHLLAPVGKDGTEIVFDAVGLTVSGVEDGEGTPLNYDLAEEELRVFLPAPAPAGKTFEVRIHHEVNRPQRGMYFRTPRQGYTELETQAWTQGEADEARHWFPCIDYPNDRSTSEIIATVPEGMRVLSNGDLIQQVDNSGARTTTFHWRLDHEHTTYLISLVAGHFTEIREEGDGVPLYYYVLPGFEAEARNSFGKTGSMMAVFQKQFAMPYPFGRYSQVAVADFIAGGMENTSITTLTERTLHDDAAHLTYSSEPLVAHELAHQWFGDLLTCRDWSQLWLNEGFATYSESLYAEAEYGPDQLYDDLWNMAEAIGARDNQKDSLPIVWQGYKEPGDLFTYRVYDKGAWVLHMLRRKLGDALFFEGIQTYLQRYRNQVVETNDLMRTLEEVSGEGLEPFFGQWVYSPGIPELTVRYSWEADQHAARLEIEQSQSKRNGGRVFQFEVPVRFVGEGWTEDRMVTVDAGEENILIPLPAQPRDVRFDPEESLLKKLEVKKPEAMWRVQLTEDPVVSGKYRALAWYADKSSDEAVADVARALEEDAYWGVRAHAAEALGNMTAPTAEAALLKGLGDSDARVRRAVVTALGTNDTDEAKAALMEVAQGSEASSYVIADALSGLRQLRVARGLEPAVRLLDRESHTDVIRRAALELVGELGEGDESGLLARYLPGKGPRYSWSGAISALAEWGWNQDQKAKAAKLLTPMLAHENRRVRSSALSAFKTLDDLRSLPVLESHLASVKGEREQEGVKSVIAAIREGRRTPEELKSLREEVETFKDERKSLEEKVEELERQMKLLQEQLKAIAPQGAADEAEAGATSDADAA